MTEPTFSDLEIRVFAPEDAGCPVEFTLDGEQVLGRGTLSARPASVDSLLRDPALRRAWDLARAQAPRCRVRLRLDPGADALHALPWEALRDGNSHLAADEATPFSRYVATEARWGRAVDAHPLRVLAVISAPRDTADYGLPPLDFATEREHLEQAFLPISADDVELTVLEPPVTAERIAAALPGQHAVHVLAHGQYSARSNTAALFLQDGAGDVAIVSGERLPALFAQGARPRLLFLAACQSAAGPAFRNLGIQLVQAGLPAVVAMRERVSLKAARKLAMTFYREVAAHGTVDLALNRARSVLLAAQDDAAIPLLLMRLRDGLLWQEPEPDADIPPAVTIQQAHLEGNGAINQGSGNALGAGAVQVGGNVGGDVVTGTKRDIRIDGGQVGVIGDGAHIEGGMFMDKEKSKS